MPADDALIGPVEPPELTVMTFNLRRAAARSPGWIRRRERVRILLQRERPTLLGLQEATAGQARYVLGALGDSYRRVGAGRGADGHGEGCPLLFDAARLELIDGDQLALSPTPDVPGSRGWGALFPRVLVRVTLRDRTTGAAFTAINTHLDVLSARARRRSAEMVAAAAGHGAALVTGDFNEGAEAPARRLLAAAGLTDTWDTSARRLTRARGTYAPHRRRSRGERRIDAVLARGWHVSEVGIDARPIAGGWASDHAAVCAVVRRERP
ncbi:endonuclease/exonuclease/phosphatase family protein [Microbacterium sp. RD1]|uniref:endonuclease/exonuclease/phosphatase family protein n=1 Tax=Microbacterium sp. RD1 TaxID=3457313 RepID=UPI003FA5F9CF